MTDPFSEMNEGAKLIMDAASLVAVVGTLAAMLPPIAALLTIVWTLIRIYETDTVRGMLKRPKVPQSEDDDD